MKRVIDTSILIDHLRGYAPAVALLQGAADRDEELWSSALVRTEVLAGMRRGEEAPTLALLDALRWQEVTVSIANEAGAMARRHLRSHPGVDTVDYVIAATAAQLAGTLWTMNVKHFPMLPQLRPPYAYR